ncbi:MAG: TPM domain-containing protein [Sphingobacteriaceae bacterium]|nr:TPM domain-containing protein [Sphingobacteriaceae bacterium]
MLKKLYFIFLFLPIFLGAQNYPAKPSNYVTDETGTLTQEQQNALNAKLKTFEDTTTNQIFVYMTASLNGSDLEQLSEEIFHNWKIGQKGKNNGVLIALFKDDRKFRIQTGYGLEGSLPDLLTKRIQDNDMRPLFKQGDYFGGINAGIDLLAYYSSHEFNPGLIKEQAQAAPEEVDYGKGTSGVLIGYGINLILLLILCLVLYGKSAKKRSSTATTIWLIIGIVLALIPCLGGIIIFVMCALLANLKSSGGFSSGGSSWSSSDSSSSWSSSSSDFGGGGGGDSGGGGSSSDW